MTTTICSGATSGTSGRLRDVRDKKVYWVTKLADGKCWMTQNLDLDLDSEVNLTSVDTDIETAWTPVSTQKGTPSFTSNANIAQSFDPGYYVYTTPTVQNACSASTLNGCGGWMNVMNGTWKSSDSPTFTAAIDNNTNTYNAHYLVGNYYSWITATAGSGNASITTTGTSVDSSICPKGWRLPVNTGERSYNTLLTSYGTYQSNTLLYGTQDIRLAPLYFVYGGGVNGSSLFNAGSYGYYWSSTSNSASNAYILDFSTSVNPSNGNAARYIGLSVRCVAR